MNSRKNSSSLNNKGHLLLQMTKVLRWASPSHAKRRAHVIFCSLPPSQARSTPLCHSGLPVVTEFLLANRSACETKASRRQLLFFGLLKNARHSSSQKNPRWLLEVGMNRLTSFWNWTYFRNNCKIVVFSLMSSLGNKNNIKLLIKIKSFRWCSEKTVHNSYFKQVWKGHREWFGNFFPCEKSNNY